MSTVLAGSHIPVLVKIMERIDKPVLELGIGYNSTPLLHWMCKEKDVNLHSYESDPEWLNKFLEFETENHILTSFDFSKIIPINVGDWGLVFIDHRPAYKRKYSALHFKDTADYIVLHDSEQGKPYSYKKIYDQFKYIYEYKKCGKPYTVVLSNRKDLSWLKS